MKPLYPNSLRGGNFDSDQPKRLKLDFNERSDSRPLWLDDVLSTSCLWQYPDKSDLQKQVSQFYGITKEQIVLTNGGDEAIELLFKLACLEQKKLILPLPAFSQYLVGKDNWNSLIDVIEPLQDLRIDLSAALEQLSEGAIVILTSPNNPTGELIPFDDLVNACALAKSKKAQIFLDEAYIEFACNEQDTTLELISQFDNLVVLRTLSKAFGLAGIRCGYILGQEIVIAQFASLAMPFNLPSPTIEVAKKAFSESARLEVSNYAQAIAQNREQITLLFTEAGLKVVDSSANFVFVQGEDAKLRLIKAACQKRNIIIKTNLTGLSCKNSNIQAIRMTIPFYIKPLLNALKFALKPELICFDMDGVLIDTSQSYDEAIKATVKKLSGETITQEDIERLRSQGGFNNDWVLTEALIKETGKDTGFNQVVTAFQEFYQGTETCQGYKTLEIPLIKQALATKLFVSSSRTLKTAIVTGRSKDEALDGVEMVGAKGCVVISDDDVESSKPSPEGIIKAMRFFAKENCWMMGDTPDDMAAANGAGALAIGIGSGSLYDFGADLVLDSVNELEELL